MKIDYMGKYVLYAIKAGKMDEFFFENDPKNGFGLTTGVTKPDSSELIRLHFGSGQNFQKTMEYVERALIADDDYSNGYESKDEHYRALLALWYKLTDLKSGTKGKNLDNQMPEPGTIDERIQLLTCEYYMRSGAKPSHIDREARREKNECVRQLAREVRQSSLEKTVKTIRSTKIFEDNRLQTQSGEPDPIEALCGLLKTINSAEQEIMPLAEQAENTPDNMQGIRAIIRRCVGMKEVSNSPVFELYDTKRETAQIGEYIRSFGLDIPNMDSEIQQAIANKKSFEEQGVVFAGDMNAQSALDSIKSFMKRSETSFNDFGKVMSTFEEVAGYYSSNNAETIRMLAGCINGIVGDEISDDTPSDLFDLACNNDIDEFFKLFGRYWSEAIENEESRQNNIKDDKKKLESHNADAIIGGPAHPEER